MGQDKVDKSWGSKGLTGFSTEAILATLNHYGVSIDAAQFASQAKDAYPLAIAQAWHPAWKGTGQFSRFPLAAADELWRRVEKDRLSPGDLALALVQLIVSLEEMRTGSAEAPIGERFKAVEQLLLKLPKADGKPDPLFMHDLVLHLGERVDQLALLGAELARDGHVDDADELATIEEQLFPERSGISRAVIQAAQGDRDGALARLAEILDKKDLGALRRLAVVDVLIHLEADSAAQAEALKLFQESQDKGELHLAMEVGERLVYLAKRGTAEEKRDAESRMNALGERHRREHPNH